MGWNLREAPPAREWGTRKSRSAKILVCGLAALAVCAAGAGLGRSAIADASTASLVGGPPHWGTAMGAPPILSSKDSGLYRRIFELQEDGHWQHADRLIGQLTDRILMGHVLAQRYLHPTKYRSRYSELRDWMARFSDHPDAKRIHRLALKRKPKGAKAPDRPVSYYGADVFIPGPKKKKVVRKARKQLSRGRAERRISRTIRRLVRRERLTVSENYLTKPHIRKRLSQAGIDRIRAIIAAGWFRWGDLEKALKLAGGAAARSGPDVPAAHWWAGLAAFKLGRYRVAARHFEGAADAHGNGAEEVSRAAFWAARAHLVGRNAGQVNIWLHRAAANPRTFYGLIAGKILGTPPAFNWHVPVIGRKQIAALMATPPGKRALALAQVGEGKRARRELRPLLYSTEPRHLRTMIAVALAARMPSAAYRAARILRTLTGERIDAALYPVPAWLPEEGYSMDRALVFALARQESAFNTRAKSRRGARGLLQLMPATARYMARKRGSFRGRGRRELFDPELNLSLGQQYMDYLLAGDIVNGNMIMMFAAYNGGPGNTRKWQSEVRHGADPLIFMEMIPVRETRLFVKRSLENLWIYRMRLGQDTPTLTALAGGGWPYYVALDGSSGDTQQARQ